MSFILNISVESQNTKEHKYKAYEPYYYKRYVLMPSRIEIELLLLPKQIKQKKKATNLTSS